MVDENCAKLECWRVVLGVFPFLKGLSAVNEPADKQVCSIEEINSQGLSEVVIKVVQLQLERLMPSVADTFWSYFPEYGDKKPVANGFQLYCDAVNALYDSLQGYREAMDRLQALVNHSGCRKLNYNATSCQNLLKLVLRATLHSRLDDYNMDIVETFYKISFKVYLHVEQGEEEAVCGGCENALESCCCQEMMHMFQTVNQKLLELELLERIIGDMQTNIIHDRIDTHVKTTCKGSFDASHIDSLEQWLKTEVLGWLTFIYGSAENAIQTTNTIKAFEHKLTHALYQAYTKTRIDQLFNIIIEYPDSQPAIEDLRVCIEKTDLRSELTSKLQRALVQRLLHPGVNTLDVLTHYVSAIKALRQLDPTGVLLETVTRPVRLYLRNREDTIKCIINSLIDDGASELADELSKGEKSGLCDGDASFTEEDFQSWAEWTPDPIDADSTQPSKSRRTCDVISMLVNVYGSKDLFVKEYTTLLAERLLSATHYDTEKEYRNLELLKLRFGETALHTCEVMLKDIDNSKRINTHTREADLAFPTTAKILSAPFWPAFKEETLQLPEVIKEQLDTFTRAFENHKGNRTLFWKPHLGSVHLDIELFDRVLQVNTTPSRAAVLWHFQHKNEWKIEELALEVKVPPMKLRREVGFWQSLGVVRESGSDKYVLVEESSASRGRNEMPPPCDDEEQEGVMASAQDQREQELSVFWSYILGMLTNLESMPLDRIHQMLKMFATQGSTAVDCSLIQLQAFLDKKVREHMLVFSGGLYRLPRH